jgi:hypothetical protein
MQTKMNAFPALTKKELPYPSGRPPIRVMREGARPISRSKTFRDGVRYMNYKESNMRGGLGAITGKTSRHFL